MFQKDRRKRYVKRNSEMYDLKDEWICRIKNDSESCISKSQLVIANSIQVVCIKRYGLRKWLVNE